MIPIDKRPSVVDSRYRYGDWEPDTIIVRRHQQAILSLTEHKSRLLLIQNRTIASDLEAGFYFAHPYSSWERGLNENTNGLIRQYFPNSKDFTTITDSDIQAVMDKLNNRPRKYLGFKTPNQVCFGIKSNVALSS